MAIDRAETIARLRRVTWEELEAGLDLRSPSAGRATTAMAG